ncbi:hypothetical protein Tco_1306245, partial [Tanacetum coccineum]
ETIDEETHMAEPNNYITATQKNFVSNDNEGRMVEKCIVEIQGTFLENILAYEWFTKECMGSITTWDSMIEKFIPKFYHLSNDNDDEDIEEEEDPNKTNKASEIFMIKGNQFDFEAPLWYDELADGKLKDKTLALKSKIEGSWGDATPKVLKFYKWLKSCFENFHEIEYEVLVKLQECWWIVNAHEIAPFTRMENYGRGSYANIKTEWTNNPCIDINRIFGRDYKARTVSCTQENQKDNQIPEPSNCKVRRFEMMKYSLNDDEEYITIKESEYLNHSKDSLDAYQELLRLIDDGWVVTTPDNE